MKTIILGVISLYRKVFSPILRGIFGNACRYNPTCSEYAYQSISKYGVIRGLGKSLVRLSTCHPFSKSY
jgi:uncharacterized protein